MSAFNVPEKKCSFCNEQIPADSSRCTYCGSLLDIWKETLNRDTEVQSQNQAIYPETEYAMGSGEINIGFSENVIQEPGPIEHAEDTLQDTGFSVAQSKNEDEYTIRISNDGTDLKQDTAQRKKGIGNGFKVFLTVMCTIIPGLGQIIGVITGIVLMSSSDEGAGEDMRSFGLALMIASVVMFFVTCIFYFILGLAISAPFVQ